MLSSLCAFLAFSAVVSGWKTTKTRSQCQTFLGAVSAYNLPTHTTTITTAAPVVTIAFTTGENITITPGNLQTINRTDTSVMTETKTITERLVGTVFSTTLTKYELSAWYENYTETVETLVTSSVTSTFIYNVSAPASFRAVNATASAFTTTESVTSVPASTTPSMTESGSGLLSAASLSMGAAKSNGASGLAQSDKDKMIVYVFKDGALVPTNIGDITGMMGTGDLDKAQTNDKVAGAGVVGIAGGAAPAIKDPDSPGHVVGAVGAVTPVTESVQIETTISESTSSVGTVTTITVSTSPAGAEPVTTIPSTDAQTAAPVMTDPASPHRHGHDKRDDDRREEASPSTSAEILPRPTNIKGLQGAFSVDPVKGEVVFPTMVSCTKLFIKEETVWRPETTPPNFVAATPKTNYVTTLSTLTLTEAVPNRKPFKTSSFITTSTVMTTATFVHTTTITNVLNYTVTSTSTSHAACATHNFLGPLAADSAHIVNVYTSGADRYTSYDIGYSRNAEDCCIECHSEANARSCMGSVFTDGRCLILRDNGGQCNGQKDRAGFFVSRPREEAEKWHREHSHRPWLDFVLSNGPCGYFYDGGLAW